MDLTFKILKGGSYGAELSKKKKKKSSYPKVVIRVSGALSLPAEREGEQRRDFWVAGIQHYGSIETCWTKKEDEKNIYFIL